MKKYAVTKTFTYEGKKYYVHADSETEAEVKKAMKLRDLVEGKVALNGNLSLREWSEKCIDTYKVGLKDVTLKKYRYRVESCVLKVLGNMKLKDIKPLHCQECINRQKGNSKYQIKQTKQIMNFLFEKAMDNKLILENPAKGIVEPIGTVTERRALSDQEENIFLKACKTDKRFILFLLMYHCGCRPSEAREALGKDIIYEEGFYYLHIRGTKTKASDRKVPIPEELLEEIIDTPKFAHIATNINGEAITQDTYKRAWESLKRAMNIEFGCKVYRNKVLPPYFVTDLVPYDLRHTFCTNLQKKGIDIRTAQYLMGHSDISITANIYTHADKSTRRSAAEVLGCNHGCNHERSRNVQ